MITEAEPEVDYTAARRYAADVAGSLRSRGANVVSVGQRGSFDVSARGGDGKRSKIISGRIMVTKGGGISMSLVSNYAARGGTGKMRLGACSYFGPVSGAPTLGVVLDGLNPVSVDLGSTSTPEVSELDQRLAAERVKSSHHLH